MKKYLFFMARGVDLAFTVNIVLNLKNSSKEELTGDDISVMVI